MHEFICLSDLESQVQNAANIGMAVLFGEVISAQSLSVGSGAKLFHKSAQFNLFFGLKECFFCHFVFRSGLHFW